MAWKFRKRISLLGGLFKLNVSKNSVSATAGIKGASVNVGKKGAYVNMGIPGTGIYDRQVIRKKVPSVKRGPFKGLSYSDIYEGDSIFTKEEYDNIASAAKNFIFFHRKALSNSMVIKKMEESSIAIVVDGERLTNNSDILQQLIINDVLYCCKKISCSHNMHLKPNFGLLWLMTKFYGGLDTPLCDEKYVDYSIDKLAPSAERLIQSCHSDPLSFRYIFVVSELLRLADADELLLEYLKHICNFLSVSMSFREYKTEAESIKTKIRGFITEIEAKKE